MHYRRDFHFGRAHSGRGFGRFGKGFMDGDGLGGRAFGMGRKLASGDLQLLILALLADKPRHGYEIIKALDERSKGFYVPSPGMVYPALTYLEEIGHATIEADGSRKRYHITDAGNRHLSENRSAADALFAQFERVGERMDRMRHAMGAHDTAHDPLSTSKASDSPEFDQARRKLKLALLALADSSTEERTRVAAILEEAAAKIAGK